MENKHHLPYRSPTNKHTSITSEDITQRSHEVLSNTLFSPEAKELIETFGGKAASLLWQMKHGNERFLIPFSILKVEPHITPKYDKKPWKEFFRGSASGDENGLVGIIESIKGNRLLDEISEIIIDGESRRVQDYAHHFDGNSNYAGISSIIVSPYIDAHLGDHWRHTFGSVVKHPDFEDLYLINTNGGRSQCIVDTKGHIVKVLGFREGIDIIHPHIDQILEMKIATDRAGFVQKATSQTEFSILNSRLKEELKKTSGYDFLPKTQSDVVFLQQRVFRKESEKKREIKEFEYDYDMNQFGDQSVFQMGLLRVDYEKAPDFLEQYSQEGKIILHVTEKNYFTLKSNRNSFGILRHPRVAGVLINPGQSHGLGSLEHDTYRLLNHNLPVKVAYL